MTTRKYAVYTKATNDKVGYVQASGREAAVKEAAAEFGGSAQDYYVAAAAR